MRRKSRTGQFVPNTGMARKVALDIARGLQYLHSRSPKVVHFDVKVGAPTSPQLWAWAAPGQHACSGRCGT